MWNYFSTLTDSPGWRRKGKVVKSHYSFSGWESMLAFSSSLLKWKIEFPVKWVCAGRTENSRRSIWKIWIVEIKVHLLGFCLNNRRSRQRSKNALNRFFVINGFICSLKIDFNRILLVARPSREKSNGVNVYTRAQKNL